jgi:hypothetical protein
MVMSVPPPLLGPTTPTAAFDEIAVVRPTDSAFAASSVIEEMTSTVKAPLITAEIESEQEIAVEIGIIVVFRALTVMEDEMADESDILSVFDAATATDGEIDVLRATLSLLLALTADEHEIAAVS